MRMRYLQAMSDGCHEAKAFAQEMKRIGTNYSYRRLVQEADKYFGLQNINTGVLMRKLTQAQQKADESLNDWYSRIFKILQDILDHLSPLEHKPFKMQAVAQLVEGLYDRQLAKDVTLYQIRISDGEGHSTSDNLRDVYNIIVKTDEVNRMILNGADKNDRARQVNDIAVKFARVKDANKTSHSGDDTSTDELLKMILNQMADLREDVNNIKTEQYYSNKSKKYNNYQNKPQSAWRSNTSQYGNTGYQQNHASNHVNRTYNATQAMPNVNAHSAAQGAQATQAQATPSVHTGNPCFQPHLLDIQLYLKIPLL